jgi:hypothetical protein
MIVETDQCLVSLQNLRTPVTLDYVFIHDPILPLKKEAKKTYEYTT